MSVFGLTASDPPPIMVPPSLISFVVFDTNSPLSEGILDAAKQICYFYPPNQTLNTQLKQVGLLQALVSFTQTFPVSTPCEVIRTRKSKSALRQVEKGYWIFVKVRLGARVIVQRDGKKLAEYLDRDLQDDILHHLISRSYARFQMMFKSFHYLREVSSKSPSAFLDTVDSFFSTIVDGISDIGSMDLLTSLNGIHRLPLEKSLYLFIATLILELESSFKYISKSCLFYRHHLLWSGIKSTADMHTFYDYITDPETGKIHDGLVNQVKRKGEALIDSRPTNLASSSLSISKPNLSSFFGVGSSTNHSFSGFLIGPDDIYSSSNHVAIKQVFFKDISEKLALIVYQFQDDITYAVFVDILQPANVQALMDKHTYVQLKTHLDAVFVPLLQRVSTAYQNYVKKIIETPEQTYKFISYNLVNMAIKSSMDITKAVSNLSELTTALNQLNSDLSRPCLDLREAYVKISKDAWIVGISHNDARIFLFLTCPDSKIYLISDEVKRFKEENTSMYL
ncbi:hypothetical protein BASA61_002813 [Batrachochytrium salamandrivorans]|nr:hypothetical protein BASA62_008299 [Batrachochytrium salamandrivorans]KAH6598738.1 hypothetical protein BASA61_002813 [Batrachochytrium salamandrivorans]KAH9268332.1 hypothetical protein BASA84_000245 [Batrachochytrium salamandrivorans]